VTRVGPLLEEPSGTSQFGEQVVQRQVAEAVVPDGARPVLNGHDRTAE
jgi:hypothetical protein